VSRGNPSSSRRAEDLAPPPRRPASQKQAALEGEADWLDRALKAARARGVYTEEYLRGAEDAAGWVRFHARLAQGSETTPGGQAGRPRGCGYPGCGDPTCESFCPRVDPVRRDPLWMVVLSAVLGPIFRRGL
jgi:hypothetical protein